jgi:hypothetical protein
VLGMMTIAGSRAVQWTTEVVGSNLIAAKRMVTRISLPLVRMETDMTSGETNW